MKILAIDTAANLCAACLYDGKAARELGRAVRDIGKGHAEVLMDVIDDAIAAAKATMKDIDAIAVAVGPGSFTGIRVGVSVARGLALALGVPATGIGTLEALAFEAREGFGAIKVLTAIDGGRDGIYAAVYDQFAKIEYPPAVVDLDKIADLARNAGVVAGNAVTRIREFAPSLDVRYGAVAATADVATYARLAKLQGFAGERPRPLYLRAPDAKPQSHLALPRKEG